MRNKRVLVTGASGFIGSHLTHALLEEGAHVGVTVRYSNVIKCERLRDCWDDIHVIEADVRNRGALAGVEAFNPEVVFHLAAYVHVGQSFTQVEECFDVNAKGTANILDVSKGAAKFVYQSSSEVYGHQDRVPFTEDMTPNPISPYGITKYAGELYCRMKQGIKGGPAIVAVRPFNVYGPYQSSKAFIPEMIVRMLKGERVQTTQGEQTREYNYVNDVVDGLLALARHDGELPGVINLASGKDYAIRELVLKIADITRTKSKLEIGAIPYRPTEIWKMAASNDKAKRLLGWEPKVSFEEGLKATVEWFRWYLEAGRSLWRSP